MNFVSLCIFSYFKAPLLWKNNILCIYRKLDELESMLRTRDSFVTELQNNIDIYRKELNESETKLQQELSRTRTLEQELQVLRNKVTEVLEVSELKTDDLLRCQNECVEVCMNMQVH